METPKIFYHDTLKIFLFEYSIKMAQENIMFFENNDTQWSCTMVNQYINNRY